MAFVINRINKQIVRIGDRCLLPGGMSVQIAEFGAGTVLLKGQGEFAVHIPMTQYGLEYRDKIEPSEFMTTDDWIHATNEAKERGGHFMGYLARAYQHADLSNVGPIRKAYSQHFFRFLSESRQAQLKAEAQQ